MVIKKYYKENPKENINDLSICIFYYECLRSRHEID